MRRRPWLVAIGLLDVIVLVVGLSVGLTRGGSESAALKRVRGSVAVLDRNAGLDVSISEQVTVEGRSVVTTGTGQVNTSEVAGTADLKLATGGDLHEVNAGNKTFAQVAPARNFGKQWAELDLTTPNRDHLPGVLGGGRYVSLLAGADGPVTSLGPRTVDGVPTTGYQVAVNMLALTEQEYGAVTPSLTPLVLTRLGIGHVRTDVWLDQRGEPRQVTFELPFGPAQIHFVLGMEPISDPSTVSIPSADEAHLYPSYRQWALAIQPPQNVQV